MGRAFVNGVIDEAEDVSVASSKKNIPNLRLDCTNHTPY